ncbi:MAG: transporter, family, putative family transporter protein [Gaiellales bacterium]|nr:transporter, family, putative family transporter protein [Gaiellales bacterium]
MRRLLVLLYVLIFVDEIALLAIIPLVPSYSEEFGLSSFEDGLILSSASFAIVFGSIPAGLLGDRFGLRRVTLAGVILLIVSCVGQAVAVDLWTLLGARLTFGVASSIIWSAGIAWLADSAGEGRPGALGLIVTVAGVAGTLGLVYAGGLADLAGRAAPFALVAAAAFMVLVLLWRAGPGIERTHERVPVRRLAGVPGLHPLIAGAVTIMMIGGFSDGVVNLLAPSQLDDAGQSATWIGLILSASMAVFFISSLLTARRGASVVRFDIAAGLAFSLAVVMIPVLLPGTVALVATMLLLRAAVLGVMYAIAFPLGISGARRATIGGGTVNGILGLAWGGSNFLGAFTAGAVVDVVGEQTVYAVLAALSAAAGIRLVTLMARGDDSPAAAAAVSRIVRRR